MQKTKMRVVSVACVLVAMVSSGKVNINKTCINEIQSYSKIGVDTFEVHQHGKTRVIFSQSSIIYVKMGSIGWLEITAGQMSASCCERDLYLPNIPALLQ